jgi:hypothetical protein
MRYCHTCTHLGAALVVHTLAKMVIERAESLAPRVSPPSRLIRFVHLLLGNLLLLVIAHLCAIVLMIIELLHVHVHIEVTRVWYMV